MTNLENSSLLEELHTALGDKVIHPDSHRLHTSFFSLAKQEPGSIAHKETFEAKPIGGIKMIMEFHD